MKHPPCTLVTPVETESAAKNWSHVWFVPSHDIKLELNVLLLGTQVPALFLFASVNTVLK